MNDKALTELRRLSQSVLAAEGQEPGQRDARLVRFAQLVCELDEDTGRDSAVVDGLEVDIYRSARDGKLVVEIIGPGDEDCIGHGVPDIRVRINEALIYKHGEVGDDLS